MMTTEPVTKLDLMPGGWMADDEIVQLRERGTETIHRLPARPVDRGTIGVAPICTVRLDDPSGRTSRVHAELISDPSRWILRDLCSTNGVWHHGLRRTEIILAAGDEIGIGGITLIAESRRSIALRGFVSRLLGWRTAPETIDVTMRMLRMAAARTGVLVLTGDDDLVPIARALHRRVLGGNRPFVVCDPARCQVKANVRSAQNFDSGVAAWEAALGGSLCLRRERLPRDFGAIVAALARPHAQVVVCGNSHKLGLPLPALPITVPPIADRADELDRLITEYAQDAFTRFDLVRTTLPPEDHAWVRAHSSWSHAAIEKATLRLVAVRISENLAEAAAHLGMNRIGLARWIMRRRLPLEAPCTCCRGGHPTAPPDEPWAAERAQVSDRVRGTSPSRSIARTKLP